MGYLDSFIGSAAVPEDVLRTSANATAAVGALTDASQTITVAHGKQRTVPSSMAADRVYTLGTSGAAVGDTISVRRPTASRYASTFVNGGAGGGRWVAKSAGLYVYRFDGTNWTQISAPQTNGEVHLNVRDFGAVGDGVTNDTAAIQAAIAALPDGGGEVYFPPGVYLINDNLRITKSGTRLRGAGRLLAQLYAGETVWTPIVGVAGTTIPAHVGIFGVGGAQVKNVDIGHLGFWGSSDTVANHVAITGSAALDVAVHDCQFEHFGRETIWQSNNTSARWTVRGNVFRNCGHASGVLGAPCTVNINSPDAVVAGNTFESCHGAIGIAEARATVVENLILDPLVYGIAVGDGAGGSDSTIAGNSIVCHVPASATGYGVEGIRVNHGSKNLSISCNAVSIILSASCRAYARGIRIAGGVGLVLSGNAITVDYASQAISAGAIVADPSGNSDITLIGNTVRALNEVGGAVHEGIALDSHGFTLKTVAIGNRVTGYTAANAGYAYQFSNAGGGTHTISASGNSHDGTGIIRMVGVADLNPGLADHGVDYSNVCRTIIGARARHPSDQQAITAAGNAITATYAELVRIANSTGGSITLTSAPTIADGYNGQTITVINLGTQNVVLQDQGTLASSNLRLTATTITLGPRQSVELTYLSSVGDWVQTGPVVAVL